MACWQATDGEPARASGGWSRLVSARTAQPYQHVRPWRPHDCYGGPTRRPSSGYIREMVSTSPPAAGRG